MSANYITIPDDDFGWLATACHIGELAALAVAILEGAGRRRPGERRRPAVDHRVAGRRHHHPRPRRQRPHQSELDRRDARRDTEARRRNGAVARTPAGEAWYLDTTYAGERP